MSALYRQLYVLVADFDEELRFAKLKKVSNRTNYTSFKQTVNTYDAALY